MPDDMFDFLSSPAGHDPEKATARARSVARGELPKRFWIRTVPSRTATLVRAVEAATHSSVQEYLHRVQFGGVLYMTPTEYFAVPAIRLSVTNWRTTQQDVSKVWSGMLSALDSDST